MTDLILLWISLELAIVGYYVISSEEKIENILRAVRRMEDGQ